MLGVGVHCHVPYVKAAGKLPVPIRIITPSQKGAFFA